MVNTMTKTYRHRPTNTVYGVYRSPLFGRVFKEILYPLLRKVFQCSFFLSGSLRKIVTDYEVY